MLLPTASSSLIRSSMMTAMSSAGLRWDFVIDGTGSRTWTDRACGPRRPSATPKSTRVPGFGAVTPAGSAEACRKTSPPSSSEAMKPKPRSASNHLTLPVGTGTSEWSGPQLARAGHRDCCRSQRIGTAGPAHPATAEPDPSTPLARAKWGPSAGPRLPDDGDRDVGDREQPDRGPHPRRDRLRLAVTPGEDRDDQQDHQLGADLGTVGGVVQRLIDPDQRHAVADLPCRFP